MTVGVDFDGTLVEQVSYPDTALTPLPYAIECVKFLG